MLADATLATWHHEPVRVACELAVDPLTADRRIFSARLLRSSCRLGAANSQPRQDSKHDTDHRAPLPRWSSERNCNRWKAVTESDREAAVCGDVAGLGSFRLPREDDQPSMAKTFWREGTSPHPHHRPCSFHAPPPPTTGSAGESAYVSADLTTHCGAVGEWLLLLPCRGFRRLVPPVSSGFLPGTRLASICVRTCLRNEAAKNQFSIKGGEGQNSSIHRPVPTTLVAHTPSSVHRGFADAYFSVATCKMLELTTWQPR